MSAVLLCVAVFVVFGPHVVKVGHFFDGVTYAGIARQMSMGIGTLDCPQYSPFLAPKFYVTSRYGWAGKRCFLLWLGTPGGWKGCFSWSTLHCMAWPSDGCGTNFGSLQETLTSLPGAWWLRCT